MAPTPKRHPSLQASTAGLGPARELRQKQQQHAAPGPGTASHRPHYKHNPPSNPTTSAQSRDAKVTLAKLDVLIPLLQHTGVETSKPCKALALLQSAGCNNTRKADTQHQRWSKGPVLYSTYSNKGGTALAAGVWQPLQPAVLQSRSTLPAAVQLRHGPHGSGQIVLRTVAIVPAGRLQLGLSTIVVMQGHHSTAPTVLHAWIPLRATTHMQHSHMQHPQHSTCTLLCAAAVKANTAHVQCSM